MSFADEISTFPEVFDEAAAARAADLYAGEPETVRRLIGAVASNAPYLAGLLEQEATWLRPALRGATGDAVSDAIAEIGGDGFSELAQSLRQAKRRVALITALADLGGVWGLEDVTGALSDLADAAVQAALDYLVGAEQARGKLPEVAARNAGLFVLAMGKLGARELNYSSDIDLIVLFDETLYPPGDYMDIRKVLIRVTQRMVKLLSDLDGGYVFRTDLRLRPNPSATPVCIGAGSAERYYEAEGRTWERAAFIKARVCAGDAAIGGRFLAELQPFIWRRHLDFAAIQDAHDIRLKIRKHKGLGGDLVLEGHDVKLGRGGIREIEFFTQTRQLICGGRDPDLRSPRTLDALDALTGKGWVAPAVRDTLRAAYIAHRTLEHRLQMIDDAQTQTLPTRPEAMARLTGFCGYGDAAAFRADLTGRFSQVHALTEPFFAPGSPKARASETLWDRFADPAAAEMRVEGWQGFAALRSARARGIFDRVLPMLLTQIAKAQNPDEALAEFERFLAGLPAGVQVFSLFEANENLLELLVGICASAPKLAAYLGHNPGVLDAVLSTDFYQPLPGVAVLTDELGAVLAAAEGYEEKLDAARRWAKELHFRIGVQLLRGLQDAEATGQAYSALAEASLAALLPVVAEDFAARHGKPPGQGAAVIAMGKLGSGEMTASSDLDLIVVYDAEGASQSDGRRPLAVPAYFARLTQALVAALTAPTSEGAVYDVDMRLRPSGRAGPVAVSLASFAAYQLTEAWTWEHLALTRARTVAGSESLRAAVTAAIARALTAERDAARVLEDAGDMRRRLLAARGGGSVWEVKSGPGRMQDVELVLQTGMLLTGRADDPSPRRAIAGLEGAGWLSAGDAAVFGEALALYGNLQQIGRIAADTGFEPDKAAPGLTALVLSICGETDPDALETRLRAVADLAHEAANRIVPLHEKVETDPPAA